ncbi:arsenite efflux pump ACR3 [Corynebacterium suranareeae]|uniref:Arsenite efflux pump ACR3 n=1 Tax=Corynebacterium suranareeae TaxID=2506452 RepID=A0A160PQI9_9CORY|nr:bile acid:sodium symporter [Corynebacterium suranareeae]BAU95824.1 arsenite efflux pump ACR3 [Corynebacterium suranareeae]
MNRVVDTWDRFQIPLYITALIAGVVVGLRWSGSADIFEAAINPSLMALLYATFLGIPLTRVGGALKDLKFLTVLLAVNFIAVPIVAFVLSRFIAGSDALLVGFLLVVLAPCIDYVIVFSGLAGAAQEKLLAATPMLMLAQIVLIPVFLALFVGSDILGSISFGPFVEAFFLLIIIPLVAAGITQWVAGKWQVGRTIMSVAEAIMVPLMMLTLFVVIASQVEAVSDQFTHIVKVVPLYFTFLIVMIPVGCGLSKLGGLGVKETRAVVFSGATRNSLVVLPLALALPAGLEIAAVVVVTQTLVELIGMVIYVRIIPLIFPKRRPTANSQV